MIYNDLLEISVFRNHRFLIYILYNNMDFVHNLENESENERLEND